jgi:predicted nuclease of predicted toxin-antitoxin system
MRLLIDNQLPLSLARYLATKGFEVQHVRDLGLGDASDAVIAALARAERWVVVSKDEDFVQLSDLYGTPQVVWVRLGNCRNHALLAAFDRCASTLRAAIASGQRVILVC